MEAIGRQVRLPLNTAVEIAMQGIKIRLGRALVTISGVVLGIAFLMNVLTSSLIKQSVKEELVLREKVSLMSAMVKSEIGDLNGKRVAVVASGTLNEYEKALLAKMLKDKPEWIRLAGATMPGTVSVPIEGIGKDAGLLLMLGNKLQSPASLAAMTEGMTQKVVLDSIDNRTYPDTGIAGVRVELFFGNQDKEQAALATLKQQESYRRIWILTISLLVTVIGISNALLMSVTERFKEIGTMKCLGALSAFIRQLFLIESSVIGVAGSVLGIIIGVVLPFIAYGFAYGFGNIATAFNGALVLWMFICLIAGTMLSIIAAIYPAIIAARMIPAMALRSNV